MEINCNQCQPSVINGVFCHETHCPNERKTWVEDRQEWVLFLECKECGSQVEEGTECPWCAEDEAEIAEAEAEAEEDSE